MLESAEKQPGERVAWLDLVFNGKRDDVEFLGRRKKRFLSPLRGCLLLRDSRLTHWQLQKDRPVAIAGLGAGRGFRWTRLQGRADRRAYRRRARSRAGKAPHTVSR